MQQHPDPNRRSRVRGRTAIMVVAIAAAVSAAGSVTAQSPAIPSPTPAFPAPTVSPDKSATERRVGPRVRIRAMPGGRDALEGRGLRRFVERFLDGLEGRGPGPRLPRGFGRDVLPGRGGVRGRDVVRARRASITVSAINGPVLTLTTADGWTRDVDTTGVTITRNGAAISVTDVSVGDTVRISQSRAQDGTWTVERIDVRLPVVEGTVGTVTADGFTALQQDGTAVTVRVSDTTRWRTFGDEVGGLAGLEAGESVVVQGVRASDGSLDATVVVVGLLVMPRSPEQPAPSDDPAEASPAPSAVSGQDVLGA